MHLEAFEGMDSRKMSQNILVTRRQIDEFAEAISDCPEFSNGEEFVEAIEPLNDNEGDRQAINVVPQASGSLAIEVVADGEVVLRHFVTPETVGTELVRYVVTPIEKRAFLSGNERDTFAVYYGRGSWSRYCRWEGPQKDKWVDGEMHMTRYGHGTPELAEYQAESARRRAELESTTQRG